MLHCYKSVDSGHVFSCATVQKRKRCFEMELSCSLAISRIQLNDTASAELSTGFKPQYRAMRGTARETKWIDDYF
jgi:hypothetical protein